MWSFQCLLPSIAHIYTHTLAGDPPAQPPPPPPPPPQHHHNATNMGNCQAIDNASLIIQHPNGKSERLYAAVSAAEVMKLNPGHYVALLLTTTLYSSRPPPNAAAGKQLNHGGGAGGATAAQPLRITRIKLLRPTESLNVGHIYRLVTTQEVMKGLMAKKNSKISNNMINSVGSEHPVTGRSNRSETTHHQIAKSEKDRRTAKSSVGAMKGRGWHPSLNSISEASS